MALLWRPNCCINKRKGSKHTSKFFYISVDQFYCDVSWLYGALKQSLSHRGKELIRLHDRSKDGLVVWKVLLATYRYNGNVDVYISTQQQILKVGYSPNFPGGALAFAESYETAFINIDSVSSEPLYTDKGKRQLFLLNFSLTDHTADLCDILAQNTDSWSELMDNLRTSLARRQAIASREGNQHAHLASSGFPTFTNHARNPPSTHHDPVVDLFINAAQYEDYKVGSALWKHLSPEIRDQVITWIPAARSEDCGWIRRSNLH